MAKWRIVCLRIVRWLPVVGVLILCLHEVGVPWPPILAWFSLSLVVISALEAVLWQQLSYKDKSQELVSRLLRDRGDKTRHDETELERVRLETEQLRRDTTQRLVSLALLLAAAFGLALAVHSKPTTSADSSQTIIQFSDRIEKDNTPSGSNETTVRFDPELQKELLAYLRKQPTSESAVVVIFLVLAAGAFLWWAIKYRPSAVPVIGAGELANAMILGADHLSQPGGGYFWGVVYALLLIGFLLLAAGVVQVFCRCKAGKGSTQNAASGEGQRDGECEHRRPLWEWLSDLIKGWFKRQPKAPNEESLLTIGFSALVLAWAPLLVAQRPGVQAPPPLPVIGDAILLPAPKFLNGHSDNPTEKEIDDLKSELKKTKKGDMLLLIGSADCTPTKGPGGNTALALKRASEVRDRLQSAGFGEVNGMKIKRDLVVPQYDNCKEKADLRAVFPFLITLKRNDK